MVSVAFKFFSGCPMSCCEVDGVAVQPAAKGHATRFTWAEIESATGSFDPASLIAEGGSGAVYLARLPDSTLAAVKLHRGSGISERLRRAFHSELDALARSRHPSIVRLLGYCDDGEDAAVVLEHVPNGSLHDKLHRCPAALPWARRTSIALRLAEAVGYLHEACEPQIIHGDITAANVLLDDRLDPKLCDFGSARTGFSASVRFPGLVVVSPGYADPHYLRTGIFSKKSDVYSFGVLLMELITGMPAFGAAGGRMLRTGRGVTAVVDDRLGGEYDVEEAAAMVSLARLCVADKTSLRPSMKEVARIIRERVPSSAGAVHERSNCKPNRGCDL